MDEELHEGLAYELATLALWGDHVDHAVEREQQSHLDDLRELLHDGHPAEAGQTVVPESGQQLLHVGVCHELRTSHIHLDINQIFMQFHVESITYNKITSITSNFGPFRLLWPVL